MNAPDKMDFLRKIDLSTWLTLAVFMTGFFVTWAQFKQHVEDFEKMANSRFDKIEAQIDDIKKHEYQVGTRIAALEANVGNLKADVSSLAGKLDRVIEAEIRK